MPATLLGVHKSHGRVLRVSDSGTQPSSKRSTIQDNLRRAQATGIAWPLPAELTDDVLEQRLFARPGTQAGLRRRSEPDWGTLARELKRPGVNLMIAHIRVVNNSLGLLAIYPRI
jgi:transposase